MENRYPLFTGGRILKKEAMWDLRDYAYGGWQLCCEDYTDGVIRGCRVRVEGNELVVGRGMIKCEDFLCLIREEERISCRAGNRLLVLKAVFEKNSDNPDYISHQVGFFLDEESALGNKEIELCRFHLREGSQLRDTYNNFADMETEYDTVNLINATMAGRGRNRLHPAILIRFAEELRQCGRREPADCAFEYQIWNTAGELERSVVEAYLWDRAEKHVREEIRNWSNERIFSELSRILGKESFHSERAGRSNVIYVE